MLKDRKLLLLLLCLLLLWKSRAATLGRTGLIIIFEGVVLCIAQTHCSAIDLTVAQVPDSTLSVGNIIVCAEGVAFRHSSVFLQHNPDAFQSADRRKDFAEDVLGDIRADVADKHCPCGLLV